MNFHLTCAPIVSLNSLVPHRIRIAIFTLHEHDSANCNCDLKYQFKHIALSIWLLCLIPYSPRIIANTLAQHSNENQTQALRSKFLLFNPVYLPYLVSKTLFTKVFNAGFHVHGPASLEFNKTCVWRGKKKKNPNLIHSAIAIDLLWTYYAHSSYSRNLTNLDQTYRLNDRIHKT